jgi:hypothetical protein
VIARPPSNEGAVQLRATELAAATAVTAVGDPALVNGTADIGEEAAPTPPAVRALTRKAYVVPFVSPPITVDVAVEAVSAMSTVKASPLTERSI